MRAPIIGISGAAGAGKDTVSDYLVNSYGLVNFSFAAPMKRAIETIFDTDERIWARDVKEKPQDYLLGHSPRMLAQTLGTEWGRKCLGENFWVNLAMMRADHLISVGRQVVISDVRFNNEAKVIHKRGGVVIGIMRPELEEKSVRKHISEAGIDADLVDYIISNNGSIADLYRATESVLEEMRAVA